MNSHITLKASDIEYLINWLSEVKCDINLGCYRSVAIDADRIDYRVVFSRKEPIEDKNENILVYVIPSDDKK